MNKITTFRGEYHFSLENLEKITSYLNKPALIALAACPGVGKTIFAMNIAKYEVEYHNKNVVYFSFEMSEKQAYVKYNIQDKSSIHIIDDVPLTVSQMKEKLQKLEDLDLVIIDYFELIQPESEEKYRICSLSAIGIGLHKLSRELNIPILLLCQLTRDIDYRTDQRPKLQDLRNCSSMEQDADIAMLLYRDSYYTKGQGYYYGDLECIIAKNRYGKTETIPLPCNLNFKVLQSNNEV